MTAVRPSSFLVHVSSSQSREIHAFRMDACTGALTLIETLDVPGTGAPTRGNIPLLWSRDRTVLYAHVRIEPFPLTVFHLDAKSGKLTPQASVDLPVPMAYLSTTLNGKFLLGASYDGALIAVNRIGPDGSVEGTCLQTLPTPPKAHCILEAPFGGIVYVTSVDGEVIKIYHLDPDSGTLALKANIATREGAGPRHLVFHPTLDRLYCINEHAGALSVYGMDRADGGLQELQWEPLMPPEFTGNARAADIHLTPDGKWLYASIRDTHTIYAFRIDPSTGLLSSVGRFAVEAHPRGFAIDPSGRFLVCAGQKEGYLAVHAIDPETGALTRVERHKVGKMPSWIEIVPAPAEFAM